MDENVTPPVTNTKKPNLVVIILVVAILALAAALVWFLIIDKKKTNTGSPTTTAEEEDTSGFINPADTANWSSVLLGPTSINEEASAIAGLSFKLPVGWTTKDCAAGGALVAFVAANADTQATCNSEGGSPVVVAVQAGDASDVYNYTDAEVFSDMKTEKITINGKEFTKSSATVKNPMEFMPPAGSKLISYYFVEDGVTYSATYTYKTTDTADLTPDFTVLAEKTLTITE